MKETKEIWVPAQYICEDGTIETYPNYKVSNLGRVKSLGNDRKRKEKILKFDHRKRIHGTYHIVCICENGCKFKYLVHRLVLSSFNPTDYFPNAVVDHINSTPGDDRLENLRWVTAQQNASTAHFKMKLTKAKSKRVRVAFPDGHQEVFVSAKEAGRSLAIPTCTVTNHINYHNGYYKKKNLFFEYI